MTFLIITSMISGSIVLGAATVSATHSDDRVFVGPSPGTYETIQEGINHAGDGDTVVVNEKSGTYSGSVQVNKSVTIVANGSVVVDGQGNAESAFIVNNSSRSLSNVSIVGFTIENFTRSNNDMTAGNGIYVSEDDLTNFSVRSNTFTDLDGSGVSIDNPSGSVDRVSIRQNDFSSISTAGVMVSGEASSSVSDIVVGNNTMASSVSAATETNLTGQSTLTNITLAGNDATDVTTGLDVVARDSASVTDVNATLNRFTNTTTAIEVNAGQGSTAQASVTNIDISENALNKSETGVALVSVGSSSIRDIALTDGNNVSRTADGLAVATYNDSSVANVLIRNATFEQSSDRAVGLTALDNSQLSNVTITDSAVNKTTDGLVVAARDTATVSDITATDSTFSNATDFSILFDAAENGSISGISMTTVEATDVTHGFVAKTTGSSTIQDIDITEAKFTNESSAAFAFDATDQSRIENTSLSDAALNRSETGFLVSARNDSVITDVGFDTINASESATAGGHFYVGDNATVTGVNASEVLATNSTRGLRLQVGVANTTTATLSDVTITDSAFNNTRNASFVATGVGDATLHNISLETINATNTSTPGTIALSEAAALTDLTIRETIGTNSDTGFVLSAEQNASASDILIDDNAFNKTGGPGVELYADEMATLGNVTIDTANVTNNDGPGVALTAINETTVTNLNVTSVLAENTTTGFELTTADEASVDGLSLVENGFNNTRNSSYVISAIENVTLQDVTVDRVNATNTEVPGEIALTDAASLTGLTVRETIGTNSDTGFVLNAIEDASAADVLLEDNAFNKTDGPGVTLYANSATTLANVTIDTADVTNNNGSGVTLTAIDQATVTDLNVTNVLAENTTTGFDLRTSDEASVDGLSLVENGFNNTRKSSYVINAVENVTLQDVTVETINASNTSVPGEVTLTDAASLTGLTVRETIGTNSDTGFVLNAIEDASAADVLLEDNAFNKTSGPGVTLYSNKAATLHNVTVDTADTSNNDGPGVALNASDNATVTDINVTSVLAEGSTTGFVLAAQDDVTVDGLSLAENGFNNTRNSSYVISGTENATLADITVNTINASNTSFAGTISVTDTAALTDLTVQETLAAGSDTGFVLTVEDSASTRNVLLKDNAFNETAGTGALLYANKTATLDNVTVDTADASSNDGPGVAVTAVDQATVTHLNVTTVLAESSETGFQLTATDETTVKDLSLVENGFNNTRNASYRINAVENATLNDLSVQTVNASNTAAAGAITLIDNATLTDLTVSESLAVDSDTGFVLHLHDKTSVSNVLLEDNAFNETAGTGVDLFANNSATLHNVTVDTADLSGNADTAMRLGAAGDTKVTDINVSTVLAKNSGAGLEVAARNDAVVEHLTLSENGFNNTAGAGVKLFANKTATLDNVTIDTADASDNAGPGLALIAGDSATVTEVNVTTVLAKGSDTGFALTTRDDAVVEGVTLFENAFNDTQTDGIALTANGSSTLRNVFVDTAEASSTQVGLDVTARDTARIRNLTAENLRADPTAAHGVRIRATSQSTTETPTITDITLRRMLINESAGSAFQLETAGGGELTDVTVREALLNGNADGIAIDATGESTVGPVRVRRALIENQTNVGIDIDIGASASHQLVSVRETLLANNSEAGLRVSSSTVGEDIELHRSLLADNSAGVVNLNDSGLVDARFNYWGDSTGPSSETGASSPLGDPVYEDALANGEGDSVSEGATSGVANVRFAPAIGGKTLSGDQLIDPVPDRQLNITIADQTIEGPLTDFVGLTVWERSILPLRADSTAAETSVLAPELFLQTSRGGVDLNRENISVFTKGTSVPLTFEYLGVDADTTRYANDDAQLIILRAGSNPNSTADLFDTSVTDNGTVTVQTEGAEVVEIHDVQLDDNGELATSFTPQQAGDYVAVLSKTNIGDGFERTTAGGLSVNAVNESVTIIGTEHISVQTTASTVTENRTRVNPGENVAFDANAEFTANEVNHVVVAYDKQRFTDKMVFIDTTNVVNQTDTGMLVRINGTVDSEPFFIEATVENGSVTGYDTGGSLEGVNQSVTVVRSGAQTETLTLPIAKNLSLNEDETRTFRYVHAAVSGNGQKRSTNAGLLTVVGEEDLPPVTRAPQVELNRNTVNFGELRVDRSATRGVTIRNTGNATLELEPLRIRGQNASLFTIVKGKASGTLQPGETRTVRVRFTPTSTGDKQATLRVRTNDSDRQLVRVTLRGSGTAPDEAPPAGGGGGGGGGQDEEGSEADVVETSTGATINFRSTQGGQPVEVQLPDTVASEQAALTAIELTTTFSEGRFRIEVTRPQSEPPAETPPLEETKGRAIQYFTADAIGLSNDRIDNVKFTFTLDSDQIPEGQSPEDVRLFRYTDGEWTTLETTHLGGDRYRATSPGFSAFAIGTVAAQEEADVSVTGASLSTESAAVGESVSVTATVENQGDGSGAITLELTANGETVDTREVTLEAGETRDVTFDVSFDSAGEYDIAVNGVEAGTLTVTEETDTATATATETPTEDEGVGAVAIIGIIVLVMLLLGAGIYLYRNPELYRNRD